MMFNNSRNKNGDPEELWIGRCAIALTIEDQKQGDGVKYIHADVHKNRVDELLEANNRYLERARTAEEKLKGAGI